MYLSRKMIPLALLGSAALLSANPCRADDWSRGIGNEEAQRLIQTVPGAPQDMWFATGKDLFYKSPDCVTTRILIAYTKPVQGAGGIWHGRKYEFMGKAKSDTDKDCNDVTLRQLDPTNTVSFSKPDELNMDRGRFGSVPGLFTSPPFVKDEQLLELKEALEQIQGCLKKDPACGYRTPLQYLDIPPNSYLPSIRLENVINIGASYRLGCYTLLIDEDPPSSSMLEMSLCLVGKAVSAVHMDNILVH